MTNQFNNMVAVAFDISFPATIGDDVRHSVSGSIRGVGGKGEWEDRERKRVYDLTKGLLEQTGVETIEVDGAMAQRMLGQKNTPVTDQPNRANEKPVSGSVLLSAKGDSSSNANVPSEAAAKIAKDTQSAKNNIRKFNNGDASVATNSLSDAIRTLGALFSMRNKGGSRYTILKTNEGHTIAIRLADHAANGNNFSRDNADNNLSIVIERRRFDAKPSEIEFTEATIPMATFEAKPDAVVKGIVKGIEDVLADKPFSLDSTLGSVEQKGGITEFAGEKPEFSIGTFHKFNDSDLNNGNFKIDTAGERNKR